MSQKRIASILVLGMLTVSSGTAQAALQLTVSTGSSTLNFTDGGVGDNSGNTGILSVSYSIGAWIFSSTIVASSPVVGSATTALIDLASINISSFAPGTLVITATDTGYTLPMSGLISIGGLIAGVTTGSVSYQSYIDTNNTAFGTEQLIGEATGSGAFSEDVSGSIDYSSPDPFALTTQVSITHGVLGGGTAFKAEGYGGGSFNAVGTAVVPEPGVVGLLGLGLGIMGLASARKRKKLDRAAA